MKFINLLLLAVVFVSCNSGSHKINTITADSDNGGLTLPEDFCALVVADDLGPARHIQVNDQGDIYISLNRLEQPPLFWIGHPGGSIPNGLRPASSSRRGGNCSNRLADQ